MKKFMEFIEQDTIFSKMLTKGRGGMVFFLFIFWGSSIDLINNVSIKMIWSFLLIVSFVIFDALFISRFLKYCLKKE